MNRTQATAKAKQIANKKDIVMAIWGEVSEFEASGIETHYCPAEQSDLAAIDAIPGTMELIYPDSYIQAQEEQYARAMCGAHAPDSAANASRRGFTQDRINHKAITGMY